MLSSRSASLLRSSLSRNGRFVARPNNNSNSNVAAAASRSQQFQRRTMGGGGAYMETNKFGARLGEAFGTVAWLWIFYRFSLDGRVLLGYEHPWDHGHHGHHDDSHGSSSDGHGTSQLSGTEQWDTVAASFIKPGEDDDDDDEDDDDDDDDDDDE